MKVGRNKIIIGDDGEPELLCRHFVGHSIPGAGSGIHTCDGCCSKPGFFDEIDTFDEGDEYYGMKYRHGGRKGRRYK